MPKEVTISGCAASAQAAKYARVDVICSYPIRPYTAVMMELSKMVAKGELDAEFVYGEGEHAQLSVMYGASASGARTFTGSSGVGCTYAYELYSPISGARLPVQMMIADRTLDPPGDFGQEHTDILCARDMGWIMTWAEDPQEAFDNHLISYRVGEDARVFLPQFVCQDGYFISHIPNKVVLPDQSQVDEFLPPLRMDHRLDTKKPISHGPQISPDKADAMDLARVIPFLEVPAVLKEAVDDFGRIFGRKYSPFVEEFLLDDAEMALFIQGAHAATARHAIRRMRQQGVKIGMAKLRVTRPWPTEAVAETLSRVKAVGVVETNTSYGGATKGGALMFEVCTSLYDLPKRPLVTSFMAGLGGEVVKIEDFEYMAKHLAKAIKEGKVCKQAHYIGFEPE